MEEREGVFTEKGFKNGDFLLEYHGDLIRNYQKALRLEKEYADAELGCFMYYFKYKGKNMCINATDDIFRQGRMVNDAPKGDEKNNCEPRIVLVGDIPHICIFASRNIALGEELRFDYGDSNLPWRKKSTEKPDGGQEQDKAFAEDVRTMTVVRNDHGFLSNLATKKECYVMAKMIAVNDPPWLGFKLKSYL